MSLFQPTPEQIEKARKDHERVLASLRTAAAVYPEQRLAQLFSNAICRTSWEKDAFYLPDSELAGLLDQYVAGTRDSRPDDAAGEIKRLRDTLQAIDQFIADATNAAKAAPNAFNVLQHVRVMAKTGLGQS
jgi:hypothetical protein